MFEQYFNIYTNYALNGTLANVKTHIRDATECLKAIGYELFTVIKAIYNSQHDLECIMNYFQTIVSIKINQKYK